MAECTQTALNFPSCKSRKVTADFSGGNISSFGGVMLLKQADRQLGLTGSAARCIPDPRRQASVAHSIEQMFRQRVYAIGCGEEDLNDHDELRHDIVLQTAVGHDEPLASPSTLCRFENVAQRQAAVEMNAVLVDQFMASHAMPPKEIILDFDATDDAVHGNQDGRFFHGYYDHYCFLPLYVFCGSHLLCAYLRPSKIDGAKHAWAILKKSMTKSIAPAAIWKTGSKNSSSTSTLTAPVAITGGPTSFGSCSARSPMCSLTTSGAPLCEILAWPTPQAPPSVIPGESAST